MPPPKTPYLLEPFSKEVKPKSTRGGYRPGPKYTLAEVQKHETVVEQLYLRGYTKTRILRDASVGLGISVARVRKLLARIQERHIAEDADQRAGWKSAQIRRVHESLREARGYNSLTGQRDRTPNHTAIARYEEILARIQGTYAPVEIDMNVQYTQALMNVIVHTEPEELARIVTEERERKRLADAYVDEHPEVAREFASSTSPMLTSKNEPL